MLKLHSKNIVERIDITGYVLSIVTIQSRIHNRLSITHFFRLLAILS